MASHVDSARPYESIVRKSARKVILPQHVADDFAAKCLDSSPAGYYLSSSLSLGRSNPAGIRGVRRTHRFFQGLGS